MTEQHDIAQTDIQVVEFDSLDLPTYIGTKHEPQQRRRLMTLLAPSDTDSQPHGGIGYVVKATNALGETFALKRLRNAPDATESLQLTQEQTQAVAAFKKEFEAHRAAMWTGFVPMLYGYATYGGNPAIIMEWVQGTTIRALLKERDRVVSIPTSAIRGIGYAVASALAAIQEVDTTLIHRDISPSNIMLRTSNRSVSEQIDEGDFDVCLIDFGSATLDADADTSFTVIENLWRGATPDYAAPEMLGHDDPKFAEMRRSPAIDVYALCSVLYEMYSGKTPYDLRRNRDMPAYHVKTTSAPVPLSLRSDDEQGELADIITRGLSFDQAARPTLRELAASLRPTNVETGAAGMHGEAAKRASRLPDRPELRADFQTASTPAHSADIKTPSTQTFGTHLEVASRSTGARASERLEAPARKNGPSVTRRTLVRAGGAAAAAFLLGGAVSVATRRNTPQTGGYSVTDILYRVRQEKGGDWGFVNQTGSLRIDCKYHGRVGNFNDTESGNGKSYLAFCQDDVSGLFGYISPQTAERGTWAIDPTFRNASSFYNGFACVQDDKGWKYITYKNGNIDYPCGMYFKECRPFSTSGYAPVRLDPDLWSDEAGEWGYIRNTFENPDEVELCFADAGVVGYEGLAPVAHTANAYGYMTIAGDGGQDEDPYDPSTWKIPPGRFDEAGTFSENGLAAVRYTESGLCGFIGTDGEPAFAQQFMDAQQFVKSDRDTWIAAVQGCDTKLWGFIDEKGAWLEGMEDGLYRDLGSFERGLAAAQDADTGKWGFINSANEPVIPFEYYGAGTSAADGEEWRVGTDA